jgi:undecaprenyl-diphosphatase
VPLDQKIYLALCASDPNTTLTLVMHILTWIGNGWSVLGLVPFFFFPHTRRFGAALGVAFLSQLTLIWAIKRVVQRARPFVTLGTHPLGDMPSDFSFPSGHASGSFTFALFVAVVCIATPTLRGRYAIAAAAVALALGISISRVYLGVHYPGDVLSGALVGGTIGFVAGRWHCAHRVSTL